MRRWACTTTTALLLGGTGCGEGEPEPIGEPLLQSFGGGFCSSECTQIELRQSEDRLQFFDYDGVDYYATWTADGLTEYALASAEAAADRGTPMQPCQDEASTYELTLTHEGETWTVSYCSSTPPAFLARGDALARALMDSMRACAASEWADSDC